MSSTYAGDQRVVVVTGGGGGIGGAIAEELGRRGDFVVTLDPLVTLDGAEQLPAPEETTAGRIIAAGGSARASSASVTDADAVRALFEGLVDELGRLDAVVNVAGITRPSGFAKGSEASWQGVLEVHLAGYLNVLEAALPIMAAAGRGRILGVTSGSGWRPADTGAYGCAKRAVAALTWQLGRHAPPGVVVNAISPIAVTRMVTAALGRAPQAAAASGTSSTGGLSLGSMPQPDEIGPLGAHLVGDDLDWLSGQVIFAGGPEAAVIDPPRLLEVVRAEGAASLAHVLTTVTGAALAPAESRQASTGASNPRFPGVFDAAPTGDPGDAAVGTCAIVSDRPELAAAIAAALDRRGVATRAIDAAGVAAGFVGAAGALAAAADDDGPLDAVVVALAGSRPAGGEATGDWRQILAEHHGVVDQIHTDAGWARAVADHSAATGRALRLVTLTDAATAGGRSRAQAAAQLARSAAGATDGRVAAFSVSLEPAPAGGATGVATHRDAADADAAAELVAHLVAGADTVALAGAELVAGSGWFGLRSHPRPGGSITFGGPAIPDWFDATLAAIVGPGPGPIVGSGPGPGLGVGAGPDGGRPPRPEEVP